MAWQYVEYAYPIAHVFHKQLLWTDKDIKIYFTLKLNDSDSWTYFAGVPGSHALSTGNKLVQYSTETEAQNNYLLTSRSSTGKILAILPYNMQAKYVRLYVEGGQNVTLYEWQPSTYVTAHDIVSGTLEITDLLTDAPLINVIKSGTSRIKIGNFDGTTYGLAGYDANGNKIFELSDSAQRIAGFSFSETALTAGSGLTGVGLAPADYPFYAGASYNDRATAPFRVATDGTLYAVGAVISGTITAVTGTIGGWTVTDTEIKSTSGQVGLYSAVDEPDDIRFWAGHTDRNSAAFKVYESGLVVATDITIQGGGIGGWSVSSESLTSALVGLHSALYSEGAEILLGHATLFSSAKIGLKADGTGKLASGNIQWDADGNITVSGLWVSSSSTTGGTITAATIQTSSVGQRVVLNIDGIKAYNESVQVANIGADGTGWIGTSGKIAWSGANVSISAFTVDATEGLYSGADTTRVQMKPGAGFWAGHTNRDSAPFYVTESGTLKAIIGLIGGWTLGTYSLTSGDIGIHATGYGEGAEILLGHATTYANAKIGLKNDGSGKIASGNLLWDTSGNITMSGNFTSTAIISGGTIHGATIRTASSGARVVLDSSGIAIYDATTQRGQLGSDGSGWFGDSGKLSWTSAGIVTIAGWTVNTSSLVKDTGLDVTSSGMVPAEYPFYAGATYANRANAPFAVFPNGDIRARAGEIGGFTISQAEGLYSGSGVTRVQMKAGVGFWSGATDYYLAPFLVTQAGVLTATQGTIAGWNLTTNGISSDVVEADANIFLDKTNTKIRVGPTSGNYIEISGPAQTVQTSNFTSGPLGQGWRLSPTYAEFQNISARGKISCAVFEKDTISAINGSLFIGQSDVIATDMTALDASTLTIEGNTTFALNEILKISDGLNVEYLQVTNIGSAPTYTVTRDLGGSYAADANPTWKKGTAVVSLGTTGTGFIVFDASGPNSPVIQVYKRNSTAYLDYQEAVRIGNLNGFLGYDTDEYGIAIGSEAAYLSYEPTNGLQIRGDILASNIEGSVIIGNFIATATTGRRIEMSDRGIACIASGTADGTYGSFLYGAAVYGSGTQLWINNPEKDIPIYENAPGSKAAMHFYNRSIPVAGAAEVGDIACVLTNLELCKVAGTPGTWKKLLDETNASSYCLMLTGGTMVGNIATAPGAAYFNGLALTANATGFTIAGGTTSKSLTVELDSLLNQDLTTDASPTFNQGNFTTVHTTTILVDHIGEHTSHTVVFDSNVDINGGAIDGTTIGANSASTGKFTTVTTDQIIEVTAGHGIDVDGWHIKDGGAGIITGGTNTFNITNGTAILDVAAACTVNIDKSLTIDGQATTITGVTQANTITLNESFTIGDGYTGTLTFSAASKTLTVEDTSIVNQDLTSDASPTFNQGNFTTIHTTTILADHIGEHTSHTVTFDNTITSLSIIPATDSTYDLGASTPKYFANAYIDKIYLNSTAAIDGTSAGTITVTGNIKIDQIIESTASHGIDIDGWHIKDGGAGIITGGTNTFNITNGTAIIDVAAGCTVNIDKSLTVDGQATTITGVTQANTITLNEGFTIGDGYTGTLTFSAASKTLTVENTSIVNQDLTTDASVQFAAIKLTTGAGTDKVLVSDADGDGVWTTLTTAAPKTSFRLDNLSIAASVGSNILTVALKGEDGNDPSASNIVTIYFRDETLTTGTPNIRTVTAALSVALSSGSTLGFSNSETGRLYVWAIDNAGTVELALSRTADLFPEGNLISTTAEGGSGGADSATTMYSTTARTNVACRCIGYIEIQTGATAGQWSNSPSKIQVMGPGVRRTGDVVQKQSDWLSPASYSSSSSGNYVDVVDVSITPTSALNKIVVEGGVPIYGYAGYYGLMQMWLRRDTTDLCCSIYRSGYPGGGGWGTQTQVYVDSPATTSATTYKARCLWTWGGQGGSGGVYFGGDGSAGGAYIIATEIFA